MTWRDTYKVHPAADVFPMMSDEELDDLAKHISENGLAHPPVFYVTTKPNGEMTSMELLDGRNRIEALDRLGLVPLTECKMALTTDIDPVAYVIAANIKRRHLTKQQQADLIVAAVKAGDKPRQVGEVSRGGRGKVDEVKAKACEIAADSDISKRTMERALAKAEGRTPKPKPTVTDDEPDDPGLELTNRSKLVAMIAEQIQRELPAGQEITEEICEAAEDAAEAWQSLAKVMRAARAKRAA